MLETQIFNQFCLEGSFQYFEVTLITLMHVQVIRLNQLLA